MELVISVGIISTAILLVIGVFTFLFRASQKSVDLTAGTVVAESIMENELEQFIYNPTLRMAVMTNHASYNNTILESGTKSYNGSNFTYGIYVTDLSNMGSTSSITQNYPIISMNVVCSWWDSGGGLAGSARTGYGLLSVEMTRILVYSADF